LTNRRLRGRHDALIGFLLSVLIGAGGGSRVGGESWHEPLVQPKNVTNTRIHARFVHSSGIESIAIEVTVGTMVECRPQDGFPSYAPCRKDGRKFTVRCEFPSLPSTAECVPVDQRFGSQALVTYSVQAKAGNGESLVDPPITFAIGDPPKAGMLQPIWWNRPLCPEATIDLAFLPGAGYRFDPNLAPLSRQVEAIIKQLFFGDGKRFAALYSSGRDIINLWLARSFVDEGGTTLCNFSVPAELAQVQREIDGVVLVHNRGDLRECSTVSLGGRGTVHGGEAGSGWLLAHESGHFLHGQADEYCCRGGYEPLSGSCPNVFGSLLECEAHLGGTGTCQKLDLGGGNAKWRINDEQGDLPETMGIKEPPLPQEDSDWGMSSDSCIRARFNACRNTRRCF
jgi:hypothetical protein